jgi:hypothetical protein
MEDDYDKAYEKNKALKEKKEKDDNKQVKVSEFSVFNPKSARVLYEDYPELREYKQLKGLNVNELLFVWFYACQASPFYVIMNKRKRVEECMKQTFLKNPNKPSIQLKDKEAYFNGKFPDRIQSAIDVMSKFRIGPRIRAKISAEIAFENLEKIINIDADDAAHFYNKDGEVDFAKKKNYVDIVKSAVDLFPKIIEQLEDGYGVTSKKATEKIDEGFDGESFMDSFHEQKD